MTSPHRQRENKFYEPGIRGRKTGATVPANLQVDKDGLENVDDFFNSDGLDDEFDRPRAVAKSPRRLLANELVAMSQRSSIGALKSPSSPRRTIISSYRSSNQDRTNSEQISMDIATTQSSPRASYKSPVSRSPASRRTSSVRTPEIMPDDDEDDDEPVQDYAPPSDKVRRKLDFSLLRPESAKRQSIPSPVSGQKRRRGGTMLLSQQRKSPVRQPSSDIDISDEEPPQNHYKVSRAQPSSSEQDEENIAPQPKRKQTIKRAKDIIAEDVEEDEDAVDSVIPSPARRRPLSPALSISRSPSPPSPKAAKSKTKPKPSAASQKQPKAVGSPRPLKPKAKPKAKATARIVQRAESVTSETDGTRRSNRQRIQPLEFWRNERIVYGSRKSGENVVPVIRQVVRVPSEEPEKKPRRRGAEKTKRRLSTIAENREAGMDKDTEPVAMVLDYDTGQEVALQIAYTAEKIQPRRVSGAHYLFEKIFQGDYISSGVMHLPKGGYKDARQSGGNTFMFYMIEGAAEVTVHDSSFIIATGGMFMVPRGNNYMVRNVADRTTKMFFAQARRMVEAPIEQSQETSQRPL